MAGHGLPKVLIALLLILASGHSLAQFNGFNTKGDFGLQSGTQPDPGWYLVAPMYLRYSADQFRDANGDAVLPDDADSLDVNAYVGGLIWVSEKKLWGGNYSFQVYPAWTNNNLEIPAFGVDDRVSTSFADLYFQPLNLGWHTSRFDFTAGLGIYAPTGRYEFGADDNVGLGMWGFELFGGTTAYLDAEKRWNLAATAFYETHTDKEGTDIRVGDLLTVEGGLGYSFLEGAASVGLAYYGQWKVTSDDLGLLSGVLPVPPELEDVRIGKHRVFGAGPELSLPLVIDNKLVALLNARYFWEWGARTQLEGRTFLFTATFPLPSIVLRD